MIRATKNLIAGIALIGTTLVWSNAFGASMFDGYVDSLQKGILRRVIPYQEARVASLKIVRQQLIEARAKCEAWSVNGLECLMHLDGVLTHLAEEQNSYGSRSITTAVTGAEFVTKNRVKAVREALARPDALSPTEKADMIELITIADSVHEAAAISRAIDLSLQMVGYRYGSLGPVGRPNAVSKLLADGDSSVFFLKEAPEVAATLGKAAESIEILVDLLISRPLLRNPVKAESGFQARVP